MGEAAISTVLAFFFLLLQINYQRNICLLLGLPSVIYHRVISRTIVSSNRNPVFICFVRYLVYSAYVMLASKSSRSTLSMTSSEAVKR